MRPDDAPALPGLFSMWRDTRMVALTAVIAAIHAAAVIPFKVIPFLPGVTDLRPAMALPIVFSLLFGPAAAWGTAIGNTVSDLFGSLGPGTAFGFVGNLLYGWLPWRIWSRWKGSLPSFRSVSDWAVYVLGAVAASAACALTIGWGVHVLRLYHFASTSGLILANNLLMSLILAPPLYLAIAPRAERMGIVRTGHASSAGRAAGLTARLISLAVGLAPLAGIAAGYAAWSYGATEASVTATVAPFVIVLILAVAVL